MWFSHVDSEGCIQYRPLQWIGMSQCGAHMLTMKGVYSRHCYSGQECPKAVSYTHLTLPTTAEV